MSTTTIPLVEEDEEDLFLARRAFEKTAVANAVQVVRDGEEAINFLKGEGHFAQHRKFPLPGIISLDLKLPLPQPVAATRTRGLGSYGQACVTRSVTHNPPTIYRAPRI